MKRVLFVVLVSLGPMVLGDDLSSSSRRAVANGFYVWQRHWSTKVESALDAELATGTYDLYALLDEPVTGRFHYRRVALKSIFSAVQLAKDVDVRAWALMCGGVVALSLDDVQTADWFHKKLAILHHPSARIEGNWFTKSPAYWRMKEKYYDAERHHQPLRVPPRLTKEQFKHLYTPERPRLA